MHRKHRYPILGLVILLAVLGVTLIVRKDPPAIDRILVLGNSITFSAAKPVTGWTGAWGMAASQESKDWVHQVQAAVAERQGTTPELAIVSMDIPWAADALPDAKRKLAEYQPDFVLVQMGDNAEVVDDAYLSEYRKVLEAVEEVDPEQVVLLSEWRGRTEASEVIRQFAEEYGAIFVDISSLRFDPENTAKDQFEDVQVAWHPGDRGMRVIAGLVIEEIYRFRVDIFPR